MAEEKKQEVIKLENKDVKSFQSGYGFGRVFGIKQVNLAENEMLLVDKDSSMTAYIWRDMNATDKNLLNSSVGKLIDIVEYQEINTANRRLMVVREFNIIHKKFQVNNNYEHLEYKIKGFTTAASIHNLKGDLDNTKFVSCIYHILYFFCFI